MYRGTWVGRREDPKITVFDPFLTHILTPFWSIFGHPYSNIMYSWEKHGIFVLPYCWIWIWVFQDMRKEVKRGQKRGQKGSKSNFWEQQKGRVFGPLFGLEISFFGICLVFDRRFHSSFSIFDVFEETPNFVPFWFFTDF